jgi:alanyl-tRNA synthetase
MSEGGVLSGETAFKLYDTYGFPVDLTQDAVRGKGMTVDMEGFEAAMNQQRAQAREAWTGSGQASAAGEWFAIRERLGATVFLGYDAVETTAELLVLVADGAEIDRAQAGQTVQALFDRTPFYAESGGQAGDTGEAEWEGGKGRITDTQKQAGDLHVHVLEITQGALTPGARVRLAVDAERRLTTRSNHSGAHLLHAALRNVRSSSTPSKPRSMR